MKMHPSAAAVGETYRTAQRHAASLAGPAPAWQAGRSNRAARRWLGMAVSALVAGGALGWGWVAWSSGTAGTAGTAGIAGTSAAVLPVDAIIRDAPPGAGTAGRAPVTSSPGLRSSAQPPPAALPTPPSSLVVSKRAGVIRMALADVPLGDAVKALAEATHTTIRGGGVLASTAERRTLHWEGTSAVAAWDALLGQSASTAVSCNAAACDLWIAGLTAPSRAPGARATAGTAAAATAAPPIAEPVRPVPVPVPVPQPASEDTETN